MMEYILGGAAFLITCRILKRNEARIKGAIGERKLARKLKKLNLPGKVHVMRDVLLPSDWGSSQIDAVAITRYGLIVCEMKNFRAKIFGFADGPNWKAVYEESGSHNMLNAVRQNNSHVMAIEQLLRYKFPQMKYLPLVVFSNKAELHIQNSRNKVCKLKDVEKVIRRQLEDPILTDHQVDEVAAHLEREMLHGHRARQNHLTAIALRKEAEHTYSEDYMAEVETMLRAKAKEKPIYSSTGIRYDKPKHPLQDTRPLYEILNSAQSRSEQGEHPERNHPDTPFRQ